MSSARKKTKNQSLQMNGQTGAKVRFLICFLSKFLPLTICQRLFVILFLLVDVPGKRIGILTGICYKTVLQIKRDMKTNPLSTLLSRKSGSGSVGRLADVEEKIKEELDKNNYHSRQQISDMIWEKFGVRMKRTAIGRYLYSGLK